MRPIKQKQKENAKYTSRLKQRGLQITSFLMPIAIRAEVKKYIDALSQQHNQKEKV